jgi:WhiB family redox-sensing transcriptional regulator
MHKPASTMASGDDWRSLGACQNADPELFFPIVATGPGLLQVASAKAVCARCEVQAECLRFAMESVQDHGVWGGKTEEERRALRRARIRQARHALAVAEDRPQRQERRRPARAGKAG